jgi:ABC-type transport system substrate-binding protein
LGQGVIDAQLKPTDTATTDSIRASHQFTYAYYGHSTGMVEPDSWLSSSYRTGGSLNFMGLSDPTLDAMIDKQRATFDNTQRHAIVKDLINYVLEHGPSTIPSTYTVLDAAQPKVHGYAPEYSLTGSEYRTVWTES